MFTAYEKQDSKKHAKFDAWDKSIPDIMDRLNALEGSRTALHQVTRLFKAIKSGAAYEPAGREIFESVFKLAAGAEPSGAGPGLEK